MAAGTIALVTTSKLPKPDPDTHLLAAELERLGAAAEIEPWDEPRDWSAYSVAVLRSPWDYPRRIAEFLPWLEETARATRVINAPSVVRWNAHKGYLLELAARGVAIVPTTLERAGERSGRGFAEFVEADEVVVKAAIGSGAREALKGRRDDPAVARHFEALLATGDVLVQPFVPEVATAGEVSLIYFGREFSHAVRKTPAAGDYRVQEHYGGGLHPHEPTAREREVSEAALACSPEPTIYARVDLVTWRGEPVVMELELIEPELFLRRSAEGLRRCAEAVFEAAAG